MYKNFGPYPAVIDVSFEVLKGEIVGFLGPNGAGKTTTMRTITGYLPPTSGNITVSGFDTVKYSLEARKHIGYLPETVPLYLDMTVIDYLTFMGRIRGMSRKWVEERIPKVIDHVKLGDYRNTLVGKLSKGYRQRTGIAQAILHEPDVLVMDEPTIGIDPIQVVETRELISELGESHTLLISSHILPEVSTICPRVLVISDGRIVADDKPSNLSQRLSGNERIELGVSGIDPQSAISAIRKIKNIIDVRSDTRAEKLDQASKENYHSILVDTKSNNNSSEKIMFNNDYNYSLNENGFIYYEDKYGGLKLPLPNLEGEFQLSNITTAIATVRNIEEINISDENIKSQILSNSLFAISKSGTISLEICNANVPSIIIYKMNFLNFMIVKLLVKIKFANIINIINSREVIPELLQKECNANEIFKSVVYFLNHPELIKKQLIDCKKTLDEIRSKTSSASEASSILANYLTS